MDQPNAHVVDGSVAQAPGVREPELRSEGGVVAGPVDLAGEDHDNRCACRDVRLGYLHQAGEP